MRFIRDFLDDVIPNELKKLDLGKAAAITGTALLGYKYGPAVYNQLKNFVGSPSQVIELSKYGMGTKDYTKPATGMFAVADNLKKYSDNPLIKFGQGMVGTTINKKGERVPDANDEYIAQLKALNERYTGNRFNQMTNTGSFTATVASNPGFNNNRVRESLVNMASYMNDLVDNGRIDSSALYAEGTRGTTIKVGGSNLKKNLRV